MNKSSINMSLNIKTKTWNKETDDLYDFEAHDVTFQEFKLDSNDEIYYILFHDQKIEIIKQLGQVKRKLMEKNYSKVLGEIKCFKNGNYEIINPMISNKLKILDRSYLDRLWIVLPKNEMRLIDEGDIIKIGRVRLKIDKIVSKERKNFIEDVKNISDHEINHEMPSINLQYQPTTNIINTNLKAIFSNNDLSSNMMKNLEVNQNIQALEQDNMNVEIYTMNYNKKMTNVLNLNYHKNHKDIDNFIEYDKENPKKENPSHYTCRICFRFESDLVDPLISPCKCRGSMSHIHYKCLKQCINTKINIKSGDDFICYIWKNFECEICLTEYPKYIKYKNLTYNLVDIESTYEEYILFDYTLYDDNKKKSFRKGIIVVKLKQGEEITVGRTQSNTIKLKDISVSRMHCSIINKDGKIYVVDKGSKFGTLIYLNKPFLLTNNTNSDVKLNNRSLTLSNCINLISGKNYLSFKICCNWSIIKHFFSHTLCCKCKSVSDDELTINIEELNDVDELNKIKNNSISVNNDKDLNDSYNDYILNLDTIIRWSDENNSFI